MAVSGPLVESRTRELGKALGARIVTHRTSPAPFANGRVDDGESLLVGKLRMRVMHTPGHPGDSMCFAYDDRVLTGGTLLIGPFRGASDAEIFSEDHETIGLAPKKWTNSQTDRIAALAVE